MARQAKAPGHVTRTTRFITEREHNFDYEVTRLYTVTRPSKAEKDTDTTSHRVVKSIYINESPFNKDNRIYLRLQGHSRYLNIRGGSEAWKELLDNHGEGFLMAAVEEIKYPTPKYGLPSVTNSLPPVTHIATMTAWKQLGADNVVQEKRFSEGGDYYPIESVRIRDTLGCITLYFKILGDTSVYCVSNPDVSILAAIRGTQLYRNSLVVRFDNIQAIPRAVLYSDGAILPKSVLQGWNKATKVRSVNVVQVAKDRAFTMQQQMDKIDKDQLAYIGRLINVYHSSERGVQGRPDVLIEVDCKQTGPTYLQLSTREITNHLSLFSRISNDAGESLFFVTWRSDEQQAQIAAERDTASVVAETARQERSEDEGYPLWVDKMSKDIGGRLMYVTFSTDSERGVLRNSMDSVSDCIPGMEWHRVLKVYVDGSVLLADGRSASGSIISGKELIRLVKRDDSIDCAIWVGIIAIN